MVADEGAPRQRKGGAAATTGVADSGARSSSTPAERAAAALAAKAAVWAVDTTDLDSEEEEEEQVEAARRAKAAKGKNAAVQGAREDTTPANVTAPVAGSADGGDTSEDEEGRTCWVCYAQAPEADLINPCECKGTVEWIHRSCLRKWLRSSTTDAGLAGSTGVHLPQKCPQCKTEYKLGKIPLLPSTDGKPASEPNLFDLMADMDIDFKRHVYAQLIRPVLAAGVYFVLASSVVWEVISYNHSVLRGDDIGELIEIESLAPMEKWLGTQLESMGMNGVAPVSEGLKGWWATYGVHSVWSDHYRTVSFQMLWAILPNAFGFSNDEGIPVPELWFLPYAFFLDMAQYVKADRRAMVVLGANSPWYLIVIHRCRDWVVSFVMPVLRRWSAVHDPIFMVFMTCLSSYMVVAVSLVCYLWAFWAMLEFARSTYNNVLNNVLIFHHLRDPSDNAANAAAANAANDEGGIPLAD